MENREEDGISALPDCLLIEILSRLPTTKDAIRTGTLSKRWQHIWASVHTLIFIPPLQCFQNPNSRSDFALTVDKTLTQCRQLKLKKFEVHTFFIHDNRFQSQLNNWILYAISCKVEVLNLCFWQSEADFLLNQSILINSCFTDLRLAGCKLNPTGAISWENLRNLCISRVIIDEDSIVNIVSGCPLLETLVLECCRWPHITSDDEFEFEFEFESESESESEVDDIIQISAPTTTLSLTQCPQLKHLKTFKVRTSFDIQFQSQINNWICYAIRCNVQELNLKFWNHEDEYEFVLDQIVFTSSCFTNLRLDGCMLNPVGAINWKSLRSLCISDYKSLDENLIENILSGSPVLETLVLENCYGYRRLDINSKSLKNMVLSGYKVPYGESKSDIIEINAPNILSLSIEGDTFSCKPLLVNVSSLVKAYLNFTFTKLEHRESTPNEVEQETLKGIIMKLRHVSVLELGFLCSKVLSCLQAKGFVSPSNVKLNGVR